MLLRGSKTYYLSVHLQLPSSLCSQLNKTGFDTNLFSSRGCKMGGFPSPLPRRCVL